MTQWRPRQSIRVITIGLHWRDDALLATEVRNDDGTLKGVRPLGGGVEFGEQWQVALIREFQEELAIPVTLSGPTNVMESIYHHEGQTGHEVVFISDVLFPPNAYAGQSTITFYEDSGTECCAKWWPLSSLDADGPALFPAGLKDILLKRT